MQRKRLVVGLLLTLFFSIQGCSGKNPQSARFLDLGNGICHDSESGRMWQTEKSPLIKTFTEAKRYADALTLGGYSDWRLPTVQELYDLNYSFDLFLNGKCNLNPEGRYWSGEKDGEGMAGAWEIADQCEPVRHYFHEKDGYVRAVRP